LTKKNKILENVYSFVLNKNYSKTEILRIIKEKFIVRIYKINSLVMHKMVKKNKNKLKARKRLSLKKFIIRVFGSWKNVQK